MDKNYGENKTKDVAEKKLNPQIDQNMKNLIIKYLTNLFEEPKAICNKIAKHNNSRNYICRLPFSNIN